MHLNEFDYDLPESLIATTPVSPRDHSRLMVVNRATGALEHRHFFELDHLLEKGDVLVTNNTKVLPARLFGHDAKGRRFEILLLKRLGNLHWTCLARPGKKLSEGPLLFGDGVRGFTRRGAERDFEIRFEGVPEPGFLDWLGRHGQLPIPPYLKREADLRDAERYQTVYARDPGSIAAPTAGLHFTPELLARLDAKGICREEVTLHVGYGTFAPIQVEEITSHPMHEEEFEIATETFVRIARAKREGRRIVAVGTTSLRTLESCDADRLHGSTRLFVYPGYHFRFVDALITNFHLPKSSLYVLVAAFLGLDTTRAAYREAIARKYRFYSYGDAMLLG